MGQGGDADAGLAATLDAGDVVLVDLYADPQPPEFAEERERPARRGVVLADLVVPAEMVPSKGARTVRRSSATAASS